ncbi:MAG: radical SAM protein, partial [Steroidobacteraceae bacterium]
MGPREIRGRGAVSNRAGRFEALAVEAVDDGWGVLDEPLPPLETTVLPEPTQSVITHNSSPDVPFDQSINPYRGCEHGCIYCFARPSHAYVNLSPGLDFETRLFFKKDAAQRLREELNRRAYRCSPINLGANTDPYQPLERRLGITRSLLEVLAESHHPVTIVTKSALMLRDLDLLQRLAAERLVRVLVSVTTLDDELKRRMEPRAASPA